MMIERFWYMPLASTNTNTKALARGTDGIERVRRLAASFVAGAVAGAALATGTGRN